MYARIQLTLQSRFGSDAEQIEARANWKTHKETELDNILCTPTSESYFVLQRSYSFTHILKVKTMLFPSSFCSLILSLEIWRGTFCYCPFSLPKNSRFINAASFNSHLYYAGASHTFSYKGQMKNSVHWNFIP